MILNTKKENAKRIKFLILATIDKNFEVKTLV